LFKEWGVPVFSIDQSAFESNEYVEELEKNGVAAFIVKISPEQKYLPKISSRVLENGSRGSNPLHLMTLQLTEKLSKMFLNI
jgi:acetolactate synthase I/II/III large subunit